MKRILAYIAKNDVMTKEDIAILTHINVAFGHLTMEGDIEADHLKPVIDQFDQIRTWNPDIKIMLSVVPKVADAFTVCSASEELRGQVTLACKKLITEYHFDGVDFDWEYPCVPSNGMNCTPADKQNYTLLCQAARDGVNLAGGGIVSIAAGADLYYVESIEPEKMNDILDYVCVMTYDLKCGFHALTGHHTQLFSSTGDIFRNSCDQALKLFHKYGFDKDKLLLGAATYSRMWREIQDRNHGFLQICKTGGGYGPGYTTLIEKYINKDGYVRYWDDEAKAPFLFDGSTFISYDDEESIACKCEYIEEEDFGGIFYWDHGSDPSKALLKTMGNSSLKK